MKTYYVSPMKNWNNRFLYTGMNNDLKHRVHEHKNKLVKGFTEKYNIDKLVNFEETNDLYTALEREKEIKKCRRGKKNLLVIKANPQWEDLWKTL